MSTINDLNETRRFAINYQKKKNKKIVLEPINCNRGDIFLSQVISIASGFFIH